MDMSLEIWQEEFNNQRTKIDLSRNNFSSYSTFKNIKFDKSNSSKTLEFYGKDNIAVYQLIKITNEKLKNINENRIKRDFLTRVQLYACFLKVGEIENIRQRFQTDAYIEASWLDNTIVGDVFDPEKHWTPDLFIENTIGNIKQDIKYKIIQKGGNKIVCEMRNVKGVFYETLELDDFPLDIQDISITITSSKSNKEIEFELSDENESTINVEDFRMQQEWKLYSFISAKKKEYRDIFRNYDRPALSFSGKIARRPGYFLNNAYLLMFLITCLGFVPFSFTVTSPSARIAQTVMLILSSINFKIAVTTRLPIVSYLTVLDKYALTALVYLAVLCVYHSVIGSPVLAANSLTTLVFYDQISLGVFGFLFVVFHIIYIIYFLYKFLKHKKVRKEIDDFENKKIRPVSINAIYPKFIE